MMRTTFFLMLLTTVVGTLRAQTPEEIDRQVTRFFRAAAVESSTLLAEAEKVTALGDAATPRLLAGLAERGPREIMWALRCLKVVKATDGRELIESFCSHETPTIRAEALVTLAELHPEEGLVQARRLFKDEVVDVRRRAIDALLRLAPGDSSTIALAFDALTDGDFWICSRAVRLLSGIACESAADKAMLVQRCAPLVARLDGRTAGLVIGLVATKAGKSALPILVAAARRDLAPAQTAAFEAAGRLRCDELVELAQPLIGRPESGARLAAIRYLAALRHRASMELLVDVIEVEKDPAREAAVVALRRISGQTFGYEPQKWREYIAQSETARQ